MRSREERGMRDEEEGGDLSDGVFELAGSDDHLHLEHVTLGDTAGHQLLQNLLLVQPEERDS